MGRAPAHAQRRGLQAESSRAMLPWRFYQRPCRPRGRTMWSLPLASAESAQGSLAATFGVGMTSRQLPVTWDAKDCAVVELRGAATRVGTLVMGVERPLGEITTAALTLTVRCNEQLASLARRKTTARVRASHG